MITTTFGALEVGQCFIKPDNRGPLGYLVLRKREPFPGHLTPGRFYNAEYVCNHILEAVADDAVVIEVFAGKKEDGR